MTPISNVFFDLDGTLADPMVGITTCMQYALGKLGRPVPRREDLTWCIGPPLRSGFGKLLGTDDTSMIEEAVRLFRERYNNEGVFEYEHYRGIEQMLGTLSSASLKLWVVSSKAAVYLPTILRHLHMDSYFAGSFGPDLSGRLDDKSELLAVVLKELGATPSNSVMIGDRERDVTAGKANGTKTVAVTYGYGSADELKKACPDYICHTPGAVADVIRRIA